MPLDQGREGRRCDVLRAAGEPLQQLPVGQARRRADPEQDLLVQFLMRGSEAETPYGINGFGSGRMPAFGSAMSVEDIELLAAYLRAGNMDGKGGTSVLP